MFWSQDKTSLKVSILSGPVVPTMPSWQGGLRGEVPDVKTERTSQLSDLKFSIHRLWWGIWLQEHHMKDATSYSYEVHFPTGGPSRLGRSKRTLRSFPPPYLENRDLANAVGWFQAFCWEKETSRLLLVLGILALLPETQQQTQTLERINLQVDFTLWLLKQAGKLKCLILQYSFSFPNDFLHFTESIKWLIFF